MRINSVALLLLLTLMPASAAQLTVFAPGMGGEGLGNAAKAWSAQTGNSVRFVGGALGAVEAAMKSQAGDVAILPAAEIGKFAPLLRQDSLQKVGRIPFALAVRKGTAHPLIATMAQFRAALAGHTVIYNDPAGGSIAGVMVEKVLTGPGYETVTRLPVRGNGTLAVGDGKAPMAVAVIPEILQAPGAEVAGTVPDALGLHIDLSGAVLAASAQPDAARSFLAYVTGPQARAFWIASGIVPAH